MQDMPTPRNDKMGSTCWLGLPNLQKIISWVDILNPLKNLNPPNPRA